MHSIWLSCRCPACPHADLSKADPAVARAAAQAAPATCPTLPLLALPTLLAIAEAAGPLAAAADSDPGSYLPRTLDWTNRCDWAAGALLRLLPHLPAPLPVVAPPQAAAPAPAPSSATGAPSGTPGACGEEAEEAGEAEDEYWQQVEGPRCLLELLPQLLATSAAIQRSTQSEPPRRHCLALLCRCLHLVAVADGAGGQEEAVPAEQRAQAGVSLLRLILSPAVAYELQQDYLPTKGAIQLAQAAFQTAAEVVPHMASLAASQRRSSAAGSSSTTSSTSGAAPAVGAAEVARLASDCAYLAVNLLASTLSASWSPAASLVPPADGSSGATNAGATKAARAPLLIHTDWCGAMPGLPGRPSMHACD